MMDKKDVELIRKEYVGFDSFRESLIKKSREVLKLSKQLIYAVHRSEECSDLLDCIKDSYVELKDLASNHPRLSFEGSYRVAVQEFVEAVLYYGVANGGKLLTHSELDVRPQEYVLGLCDLTGELVRRAVYLAGKEEYKEVVILRDLVDDIFKNLLTFDFRDNETRRKFDSVKYDLRKLEDLVLDLKLKDKI